MVLPGFAAATLLHADGRSSGAGSPASRPAPVIGVATGAAGVGRDGRRTAAYAPGAVVRARATLLAEGARGHLSDAAVAAFGLRAAGTHQTYALGVKEVWRVPPEQHTPGVCPVAALPNACTCLPAFRRRGHAHGGLAAGCAHLRRRLRVPHG